MSNMAISMNNLPGARVNAGLDDEDISVYNEYNEPDRMAAKPVDKMSSEQGTRKSTSKTEIAKLVLQIAKLIIIVLGVIIVTVVLIELTSHDHKEFKKNQKSIVDLEKRLTDLREESVAHNEQMADLTDDLALLREAHENHLEDVDPLKPHTEEKCIEDHSNAVYVEGKCYFSPAVMYTVTWKEAVVECRMMGGTLASPRTEQQWQAVYNLSRTENSWVGFHQNSAGLWSDMAGTGATDNVAPKVREDTSSQYCAIAWTAYDWPKFLGDLPCEHKYDLICEK